MHFDFSCIKYGRFVLVLAETDAAKDWVKTNIEKDRQSRDGDVMVLPEDFPPILEMLKASDFSVSTF